MRLYHASTIRIEKPDVLHSRDKLDFGRGFYLTRIREQAVRYAERFTRRGMEAFINEYELDEEASGFVIKTFPTYDEEWLDYVALCRKGLLTELSYDAVDFIDDTGVFDYNPYSQKREFCFDPERIRALFKAESRSRLIRKAYGRSAQKVLRRAAQYADDRTLQESMRKIIEMLTQGLVKELGEKDIRCSRNDSEEFFRKNYHVPEPVLINLRDVCEDSRNVAYFYESSTARRARRLKQLTEMGAPSIIIYNEQRLKYESELYRLLAEYVGRQPETDDSVRRFVGDTYMTLLALPNQEGCNLKQDEDAIKEYHDAAEKIMQKVRELIPLVPAQAK